MEFWKKLIAEREKKQKEEQQILEKIKSMRAQKKAEQLEPSKKSQSSDSLIEKSKSKSKDSKSSSFGIDNETVKSNENFDSDISQVLSPRSNKRVFNEIPKETKLQTEVSFGNFLY